MRERKAVAVAGGKMERDGSGDSLFQEPDCNSARGSQGVGVKAGDQLLVVVRGEKVIVLEKPKSHHAAIRGLGARIYPGGHLAKERKSWD
jgi:hypothetical protein